MKAVVLLILLLLPCVSSAAFQAGAVVVDASPKEFPVIVNGGMLSRTADTITDPINARALVLSDQKTTIAIVVVDSCMMPRPLLDEAKQLASKQTGIPTNHILIAATHTHTAPSALACLGTRADERYTPYLRVKIAEAITAAHKKLQPARIGWKKVDAPEFTAVRRWIHRPGHVIRDPFGNETVRANMHTGRDWNNVTGESGPEDPDLTLISIQTADRRPLAILANFSMHYFSGVQPLSADYFGIFARALKARLGPDTDFVGIMSHGCSGDIWRRDYAARDWSKSPPPANDQVTIDAYANQLANRALQGYDDIPHKANVDIAMAEKRMTLNYRLPNLQMLEWAQRIVDAMGERDPNNQTEVYAMEQLILHQRQKTEIVVQGLRVGDIAIATTPTETYALTGLKLKAQSPLENTMILDLANGGDGYIPPPEQHVLGGYNTWPARSAGLEILAEPRITEACLQLLEQVTGQPRRPQQLPQGPTVKSILNKKPSGYWRLEEFAGPRAIDQSGNNRDGFFEEGVVFHLEGAPQGFNGPGEVNRTAHFCGGRLRTRISDLGNDYTVSIWFWNGMPDKARDIAGWMFSRDRDHATSQHGDHLGLNGDGQLVFLHGHAALITGNSTIKRWTWNHVRLVRKKDRVRVYLNDAAAPEIDTNAPVEFPENFDQVFFGGRSDRTDNWQGRLDEIAIYNRALKRE